jgi:hypothetical protein
VRPPQAAAPRRVPCLSFAFRNPLCAVHSQNDAAQDFPGIANILQPGLNAGRNVTRGRMRRELPQGLKFKIV